MEEKIDHSQQPDINHLTQPINHMGHSQVQQTQPARESFLAHRVSTSCINIIEPTVPFQIGTPCWLFVQFLQVGEYQPSATH